MEGRHAAYRRTTISGRIYWAPYTAAQKTEGLRSILKHIVHMRPCLRRRVVLLSRTNASSSLDRAARGHPSRNSGQYNSDSLQVDATPKSLPCKLSLQSKNNEA